MWKKAKVFITTRKKTRKEIVIILWIFSTLWGIYWFGNMVWILTEQVIENWKKVDEVLILVQNHIENWQKETAFLACAKPVINKVANNAWWPECE